MSFVLSLLILSSQCLLDFWHAGKRLCRCISKYLLCQKLTSKFIFSIFFIGCSHYKSYYSICFLKCKLQIQVALPFDIKATNHLYSLLCVTKDGSVFLECSYRFVYHLCVLI